MKSTWRRALGLCLLWATLFLCACPASGGTCTHHYVDGVCTLCGESEPCTHTYSGGVCTKCGAAQNCDHSFENGACTKCGAADPTPPREYGEGGEIKGAGDGLAADAAVLTPATYDEGKATEVVSGTFVRTVFGKFAAGAVFRAVGNSAVLVSKKSGETYDGKGTVLLLEKGLRITEGSLLTFKNLVIVGDVEIDASHGVTFENCEIVGDVRMNSKCETVVFKDCRLTGEKTLTLAGADHAVIGCYIGFTVRGVLDQAKNTILKYCRLEGTGTGLAATAEDGVYTYNTFLLDKTGVGVALQNGSLNLLVGMNIIRGAKTSLTLNGVKNTAVVKNSVISVNAENSHSIYICDNEMGGRLTAKNNDYILADGNAHPADGNTLREGNTHESGDTLLDVTARAEVGADEALLPQVDKDLFLGMERKEVVREYGAERAVYTYMMDCAKTDEVVLVPPGKYTTNREYGNFREEHSNTTVYAYGVYIEAPVGSAINYGIGHIRIFYLSNFTLKGVTVGYEQPSAGQAYVLKKETGGNVRIVPSAGMWQEFIDSAPDYFNTVNIGIQRAGTFYPIGDFSAYSGAVQKHSDGTMTVRLQPAAFDMVETGDILTCRIAKGEYTTQVTECENVSFRDMTVYGYSGGFAFYESRNRTGVTYYRVLNTVKPAPVIDGETYERYLGYEDKYGVDLEVSVDEENRYRGGIPRIGSVDATHASNNLQGSQLLFCLFEGMCDDGTNQNSFHSRLSEYIVNGEETTLIYKGVLPNNLYHQTVDKKTLNINRHCIPHKQGDRVYVYTSKGELVCDTEALTAAAAYASIPSTHPHADLNGKPITRYAVTVKTADVNFAALDGYDLTDDSHEPTHKVLVDNRSMGSSGFLYDNTVIQNNRSRGLLLKSSDGTVKNCTFRNIAKVAVAIIYEIQWGESGASENVRVENCLIDHTSYSPNDSSSYEHVPIDIMGLSKGETEEKYLLYRDIYLIGNVFVNRDTSETPYAVYIQGAKNIYIRDNDFGTGESEDCLALWVNGAAGIELSGNLYPPAIDGDLERYVEGEHFRNIYGTDVSDENGNSYIQDQP